MDMLKDRKEYVHLIYLVGFIVALHTALPTYIHSTFLGQFASEQMVGLLFSTASLLSIFGFMAMPSLLRKFGNYRITLAFSIIAAILTFVLSVSSVSYIVIGAFILYSTVLYLIWFDFDLLLESFSDNATTGETRGLYMTATNVAWVMAPSITGFLLGTGSDFSRVYLYAGALLLVALPIFASKFNQYHDPKYKHPPFWKTLRRLYKAKNIFNVFMTEITLRFFYVWMIIYTPIYLNQHLGIDWTQIGMIFTIMLLPFIFLQFPLGKLADTRLGEKEIMAIGFGVLVVASAALSFITTASFWVWALALFATRVGASAVQVMNETYFFKKTNDTDADLLEFFRMTRSVGYIIAPLLGSLVLLFIDLRYLFIVLGALMTVGIVYALKLEDTL